MIKEESNQNNRQGQGERIMRELDELVLSLDKVLDKYYVYNLPSDEINALRTKANSLRNDFIDYYEQDESI